MEKNIFYHIIDTLIMSFTFLVALTLFVILAIVIMIAVPISIFVIYIVDNILPKFTKKRG